MKALLKGGLFGGLLLFVWSSISWMALPFHKTTFKTFTNEAAVETALLSGSSESGLFLVPNLHGKTPEEQKAAKERSFAFIIFNPKGWGSMPLGMLLAFLGDMLAAFLMTWIAYKTAGLGYWQKVGFVVAVAVTAGVMILLPNAIWWGFPAGFTILGFLDLVAGWFLAGLVIAKVTIQA